MCNYVRWWILTEIIGVITSQYIHTQNYAVHFHWCSVAWSFLTLRLHGLQHARLACLSPSPGACSDSCPLSWWCHPSISICFPFPLLLSIFPSIRVFSNASTRLIRWPKYWSFSFSPPSEYSGLISFRIECWSHCCPKESQDSSPTSQFKSINSSVLSFLYGLTLTSITNY